MNDYLLVGAVAALIAAIHRAVILCVYRSWFRQGFAGDAAFHLAVVREIKKSGSYSGIPEFLIRDEPDSYPILFHRFASLFPSRLLERYSFIPNAVIWIVAVTMATLYAHYVAVQLFGFVGPRFALVFLVFFLMLASNLSLDMNGLNYVALSERLLSRFCCSAYFVSLATFISYGDTVSLVVAIVTGTLAMMSSMFGRQTMAFVNPIAAVLALNGWPIVLLAGSFLGALLLDRGYFLRGLRHMAWYSHAYRNHTKHSRYYRLGLSRFTDLKIVFGRGKGWRSRIYELEHHEPSRLAFRYPEMLLMLFFAAFFPGQVTWPELAIAIASCIIYFATSTEALRHFGEANRYIEFALWLIPALALTRLVMLGSVPTWVWLLYGAWTCAVTIRKYGAWFSLSFPAKDRLAEFIAPLNLGPAATLFTVPFSLGAAIHVRTQCRVLMYQGSAVNLGLYEKFMEEIPYLKREWQKLATEFAVSYIISERSYLDVMKSLLGWEYDFSTLRKVAEDDRYVAYQVSLAGTSR